jgi:hypothetical protein
MNPRDEEIENNRLLARDYWLFRYLHHFEWACYILAVIAAVIWCAGCTHTLPHRPTWESYDQANLKALVPGGNSCPAVYDAPGGELRLCR